VAIEVRALAAALAVRTVVVVADNRRAPCAGALHKRAMGLEPTTLSLGS
jgi:hypothetical protein